MQSFLYFICLCCPSPRSAWAPATLRTLFYWRLYAEYCDHRMIRTLHESLWLL